MVSPRVSTERLLWRRMKSEKSIIVGLLALLLYSCGGVAPQRPSQRKGQTPEADSTQLAIMEMNLQLAKAADRAVLEAAQAQEESYALYEGSAWMHIYSKGDETQRLAHKGTVCTLYMRIYTLDGRQLEDSEGTYTIGKYELPTCIEQNIRELRPGAHVRLFAPFYTAFGAQGTAHIPPYENVMIDMEWK